MSQNILSVKAGENFTGKDHIFVKYNGSGDLIVCPSGEKSIGVLQDSSPKIGELGSVVVEGTCKVRLGATISQGAFVRVGSNGRAIATIEGDSFVAAQLLEGGSSGDIVECKYSGSSLSESGDMSGPISSTDNAVVRFDGTTGKLLQNSLTTISDIGTITTGGGTAPIFSPEGLLISIADNDVGVIIRSDGTSDAVELASSVWGGTAPSAYVGTVTNHDFILYSNNVNRYSIKADGQHVICSYADSQTVYSDNSLINLNVESSGSLDAIKVINETSQIVASIDKTGEIYGNSIVSGGSISAGGEFIGVPSFGYKIRNTTDTDDLQAIDTLSGNRLVFGTSPDTAVIMKNDVGTPSNSFIALQTGSDNSGSTQQYGSGGLQCYGDTTGDPSTGPGRVALYDADGGSAIILRGSSSTGGSSVTYVLPDSDGTAGQVLSTDGNGNLSWITP